MSRLTRDGIPEPVSRDQILRPFLTRKFWGWRGQKFLGKKTPSLFITTKFSGKISSPKISSGNFGSNSRDSPSRGNFEAQNFLETRGDFTRKFWDHLIIELKSVPFPSTGRCLLRTHNCVLCCTHTCIESHKRCPKSLDERGQENVAFSCSGDHG